MFKIPLLDRKRIVSDEGFTVTFISRNQIRYDEPNISLFVDIDGDGKGMDIVARSTRTSEPGKLLPDADTMDRVLNNIARALTWKGWSVDIIR